MAVGRVRQRHVRISFPGLYPAGRALDFTAFGSVYVRPMTSSLSADNDFNTFTSSPEQL